MKTISVDIKHSVFENDTEAIMYVTRDIYSDSYIISIPVITFSWEIRDNHDYEDLLKFNLFGDVDKRKKLVGEIKKVIENFG